MVIIIVIADLAVSNTLLRFSAVIFQQSTELLFTADFVERTASSKTKIAQRESGTDSNYVKPLSGGLLRQNRRVRHFRKRVGSGVLI